MLVFQQALQINPSHAEVNFLIGEYALRADKPRIARRFLQRSVGTDASLPSPMKLLADVYSKLGHYFDAEEYYTALNRLLPDSPQIKRNLGELRRTLGMMDESAEVFEEAIALEPDNAINWLELADTVGDSYSRFQESEHLLRRAVLLASSDGDILLRAATRHSKDGRFAEALVALDRFMEAHATTEVHPLYSYSRSLLLSSLGRHDEARSALLEIRPECLRVLEAGDLPQVRRSAGSVAYELAGLAVQVLGALGDWDEVQRVAREFAAQCPPSTFEFDETYYLPNSLARIDEFARLVDGRDIAIIAHGPSLRELESRIGELEGQDIFYVTFNRFPQVEDRILSKIGRRLDAIMTGNPRDFRDYEDRILEFCERPEKNLAILSSYAASGIRFDRLEDRPFTELYDHKLLYFHSQYYYPPVPSHPLHFQAGNTLSVAIPLMVLGAPKRIFLFGADGGGDTHGRSGPYFFSNETTDENEAKIAAEVMRRMCLEAAECDLNARVSMHMVSALYNKPIPPIYNCSPHSNHKAFEKLTYDEAFAKLSE